MIFLRTIAVFLGTVIGAGFFGLPYIASKSGFFIVAGYLFLMVLVAIAIHLMYAQVCVGTVQNMRLPGYTKEYLGNNWAKLASLVIIFGLLIALVPYLIIGGKFLSSVFSPYFGGTSFIYSIVFFAIGAYFVFKDIRNISKAELFLLFGIIAIIIFIAIRAIPFVKPDNLTGSDIGFLFLPYGAVLFSLWGSSVIPELKELMAVFPGKKMRQNMTIVICAGLIITFFVYLVFVLSILGVSGKDTSNEAISGLAPFLGKGIVAAGSILGAICCFTTFIAIALVLKKTLWYDYKVSKNLSWLIVCALPLILFILGARDFIKIIGFIGAVSIGLEATIVVFLYNSFLKKRMQKKPSLFSYSLIFVFIAGIIIEIFMVLS